MVELDRRAVEIVVHEQVVEADADLQDALVQMADLVGRGAPEQLERLVLLEELAGVELGDRLAELGRRRLATGLGEVGLAQPLERALQLGMRGAMLAGRMDDMADRAKL